MTIEELERKMEAGFNDLEAKITAKITAEGIDTRRHFDIMVERRITKLEHP